VAHLRDGTLTDRLRVVPKPGEPPVFHFTLDDLDELAGFVAAEANHAKDKKLQKELDQLCDRIQATLEATRTRTIDSNSPFYGPCRTSTLAIPAHQSSAPVYMERWFTGRIPKSRVSSSVNILASHRRNNQDQALFVTVRALDGTTAMTWA